MCLAFGAAWHERVKLLCVLATLALLSGVENAAAAGSVLQVAYSASKEPDALQLDVTFTLWLPETARSLRGVIVHQHGCGFAANAAGETAAHDLHWQAPAAKWDCALLAPRYRQTEQGAEACELWMNPRHGSRATFLRALDDLAAQTQRPELRTAPWCLWGHSGGAYWASLMQTLDPQRIVAAWLRSGTAYPRWTSGEIAPPELSEAVYRIPTMLNPGIKESTDGRAVAACLGSSAMFKAYREKGALIGFAADPLSGHDCGDSRYLAIPFFDACLAMRLPEKTGEPLREMDTKPSWLAELMSRAAVPAAKMSGGAAKKAVWLPNEAVARAWMQYVKGGAVADTTPPPAPTRVQVKRLSPSEVEITWDAVADFESGLRAFVIERNRRVLAQVPETPIGKYGRPLFQTLSFHDTPEPPLPAMRNVDTTNGTYRVIAINGAGLKSEAAAP
jgi:hypothetical protein